MAELSRRTFVRAAGVAFALAGLTATAHAQESVRIGYVVSKTGVNAAGAGTTTIPSYQLWTHDVNAAGGLLLPDGRRVPLEIVDYDDRSQTEEAVRGVERLASQDKVDFILPPWGTGFNLAVAPLLDRLGYPHLAGTSVTSHADEFAARWKRSFWLLGGSGDYMGALGEVVSGAIEGGTVNNKVAIVSVADGFGIELVTDARKTLAAAGLDIVMDKSYPLGTQDFGTLVAEASASGADTFLALSYPPDTFAITKQARLTGYNPKIFYTGVGTSFPAFSAVNEGDIDGVMSLGGIDPNSQALKDFAERHRSVLGSPPDSWASSVIYASLQMLEQAIARHGVDREAVSQELATGTFDTVIGEVKMEKNQIRRIWFLGQWQDGVFVGLAPTDRSGASTPVIPKPDWGI